jgi:hypothetical protein
MLYFDYILDRLNDHAAKVGRYGKLNMLSIHLHSEDFYAHLLNLLYGWKLNNANELKSNVEAIDLICDTSKVVVQVSATSTKQKVESSLKKDLIEKYASYTFKFVSISNEVDDLRGKSFANPHGINFDSKKDFIDINSILSFVKKLEIDKQQAVYNFLQKELGENNFRIRRDSNLASIINILAKEDLGGQPLSITIPFNIQEKIDYNELGPYQSEFDEYSGDTELLEERYADFAEQGVNKSKSVLRAISAIYIEEALSIKNSTRLLISVIDKVKIKVLDSNNFESIPDEELNSCVTLIVIDAFMRCKIFKKPPKTNVVS